MKSLTNYIIESMENDPLNEGRIWNAIKNWWNKFWEPSNKKYDRYVDSFNNASVHNDYIKEIENNFNISYTKLVEVSNLKELTKIVYPNNITPSKDSNDGFWDFIEDVDNYNYSKKKYKYYIMTYSTSTIRDTIALIRFTEDYEGFNSDYLICDKIQILNDFSTVLKLSRIMRKILCSEEIADTCKTLAIVKSDNPDLYNKAVNDCNFEKEVENNKNICVKDFIVKQ